MIYIFSKENNGSFDNLELVDPTIEIVGLTEGNPNIQDINFNTLNYSIEIVLKIAIDSKVSKYVLMLENVKADTLDWTSGQDLPGQVLEALNTQFSPGYISTKSTIQSVAKTTIIKENSIVKKKSLMTKFVALFHFKKKSL